MDEILMPLAIVGDGGAIFSLGRKGWEMTIEEVKEC
jgi:hypothetical protein